MRSRFPKVRSSIQRAFVSWYIEHQDNFIRPLLWVLSTTSSLSGFRMDFKNTIGLCKMSGLFN